MRLSWKILKLQAEERGKAIGEAQGKFEKAVEIARKLQRKGTPVDEISELTGLSVEEIESL